MGDALERLREISAKSSLKVREFMRQETMQGKFLYNSKNQFRLTRSLSAAGCLDLANKTLLMPEVHAKHAEALAKKLIAQSRRAKHLRFVTLLDTLQVVDVSQIVVASEKMRQDIHAAIADVSGLWLLGVVEVEIVNLHMMRKIRDHGGEVKSEMRKLEVLEAMSKRLPESERLSASLALIHFHGVASANSELHFESLRKRLNKVGCWRTTGHQIEIKKLSDQYRGRKKTTAENLRDISRYITKGGNDFIAGKAYLRYKISFDNMDVMDEDAWVAKNYRRNEQLRNEILHEGIEDVLSLTGHEIVTLARVIDTLMDLKSDRTGYLIHAKSGAHSRALSTSPESPTEDLGFVLDDL